MIRKIHIMTEKKKKEYSWATPSKSDVLQDIDQAIADLKNKADEVYLVPPELTKEEIINSEPFQMTGSLDHRITMKKPTK